MSNKVIICVDDERIVLDGLQSQLSREFGSDIQIEVAESAEEALEVIDDLLEEEAMIPIVITDQMMPGMKGNELLKMLAEKLPNTLNILLTGQADAAAVGDALNNGNLYRYMAKPWESADLMLTVREALIRFEQDEKLEHQNKLLKKYNEELEHMVDVRTQELNAEKEKSDNLLVNILPEEIAEELKIHGSATPKHFDQVTVMFTDFKGFTSSAKNMPPAELVERLNECFSAFDEIIEKHCVEKIKTIGDAYMCVGGLPIQNSTNAADVVNAAWEMIAWINDWNKTRTSQGEMSWDMRIGVHTGEVVAGVIGRKKFQYDLWGDAVNVASRMESTGEIGKLNVSSATYELIKDQFNCDYRGEIEAKNRGEIGMFFVSGKR